MIRVSGGASPDFAGSRRHQIERQQQTLPIQSGTVPMQPYSISLQALALRKSCRDLSRPARMPRRRRSVRSMSLSAFHTASWTVVKARSGTWLARQAN